MKFDAMSYGPIGVAVKKAMPHSEADPIGVFAASLSLFSAAINGHVHMENGRPVVVWTALAGRSAIGRKGYALGTARGVMDHSIGGFLGARIVSGISSGPSLVNHLWNLEMETMGSENGVDGRALIVEEEWASILKRSKRCPTFSQQLRTAWDGKTISNTTKGKGADAVQEVYRPLVGFHVHITPGEWAKYVSADEALGGTFNRILPVLVERSKMLPYDHVAEVGGSPALTKAYKWAQQKPRVMSFNKDAGKRYDELRSIIEDRMVELPETLSCYLERTAEQVARVAAVLTAAEMKTKITKKALEAAWEFVQYSMTSVEKLVKAAAEPKRTAKPVTEIIRETLIAHGGEAPSNVLQPKVQNRVNAAGLKALVEEMDDVVMERVKTGGRGAPTIMYRLVQTGEEQPKDETPEEKPARPTLRVVETVEPKPARKRAISSAPRRQPRKQAQPKQQPKAEELEAPSNPLAHLLRL
ncbi:DUF3987 domain-containing protein [Streptomyces noursei]|uniref:DUF3987 domain-containing protein n=1 Tax=Streptomyces noursei TaxID=1971 RepID=UPI00167630A9|nr:DUF3987 domain-containing protein [Streptomyces noursei]MCZ1015628.1 DUF3987 domain-containing protein [Streptomyces noursei]GGW89569.1 hypothetical protein GCM10010341_08010 [Streptomyces noursei]